MVSALRFLLPPADNVMRQLRTIMGASNALSESRAEATLPQVQADWHLMTSEIKRSPSHLSACGAKPLHR